MKLQEFIDSPKGHKLAPLLGDPSVIARMEAMGRLGRPAVRAIDEAVAEKVGTLDNVEKQHVGRWVRDVLARRGLKPLRQLDWRGGKVFASGAVYGPMAKAEESVDQETPTKVLKARALLAAGLLDRSRPTGTVDDFLTERRAAWGEA